MARHAQSITEGVSKPSRRCDPVPEFQQYLKSFVVSTSPTSGIQVQPQQTVVSVADELAQTKVQLAEALEKVANLQQQLLAAGIIPRKLHVSALI